MARSLNSSHTQYLPAGFRCTHAVHTPSFYIYICIHRNSQNHFLYQKNRLGNIISCTVSLACSLLFHGCCDVLSMFVLSKWQCVALPLRWCATVCAPFYTVITSSWITQQIPVEKCAHQGASASWERQRMFKIVTWTKQTWTKHHHTVSWFCTFLCTYL